MLQKALSFHKSKSTHSSNTQIKLGLFKGKQNIFETVEDFERKFTEINDNLANYLAKYNSLESKLRCNQSKYKEMEKEKKNLLLFILK